MEGALDATVRLRQARKAFGKTLLEFQNTRFKLAEIATITRVARTFIDSCIQQQSSTGTLDACHGIDGQVVGDGHGRNRCSMSACSCTAATAT